MAVERNLARAVRGLRSNGAILSDARRCTRILAPLLRESEQMRESEAIALALRELESTEG